MGDGARMDVLEHRRDVLQRLLKAGVPPTVLEALLPGWEDTIAECSGATDDCGGAAFGVVHDDMGVISAPGDPSDGSC